jgi:hypothetical protein
MIRLKDLLNESTSTSDENAIRKNLKKEKDGIYVLKGGLEKGGGWNLDSLQKGKPLYYTTDFDDPKLKSFQEDGMVWVDIDKGEMEVNEY